MGCGRATLILLTDYDTCHSRQATSDGAVPSAGVASPAAGRWKGVGCAAAGVRQAGTPCDRPCPLHKACGAQQVIQDTFVSVETLAGSEARIEAVGCCAAGGGCWSKETFADASGFSGPIFRDRVRLGGLAVAVASADQVGKYQTAIINYSS